jgi:hypothetical protein
MDPPEVDLLRTLDFIVSEMPATPSFFAVGHFYRAGHES